MYVKIHNKHNKTLNTGSVSNLIQYLEKENIDRDLMHKEQFFNQYSDNISGAQAKSILDSNKGRLSKKETKFYMVSLSPSKEELRTIGNDTQRLKMYVNNVMDDYAKNFNRFYEKGNPHTQLRGDDLVYFAKLENERTFKYSNKNDREILEFNKAIKKEIFDLKKSDPKRTNILNAQLKRNRQGKIIKEGVSKDGDNRHIHIVIHRYDRKQKFKLSPMANARGTNNKEVGKGDSRRKVRGGFDRVSFFESAEKTFDRDFSHERDRTKSFEHYKSAKLGNRAMDVLNLATVMDKPELMAKMIAKRALMSSIKDKSLQKAMGMATTNPRHIPKKLIRGLEKKAVKAILEGASLASYTNPATAMFNIARKTISLAAKSISKGAGI